MVLPEVQNDTLPVDLGGKSTCVHSDGCGCEVSSCCLDCPLPVCKFEYPQGLLTVRTQQSRLQVLHLRDEGFSRAWIAYVLGISLRSVDRHLSQNGSQIETTAH